MAGDIIHVDDEESVIDVIVSDNQYVAGAILYSSNGTEIIDAFPGTQAAAGEDWTFQLDVSEAEDGVYLLQVYDYAMNCSTYRLFLNTEETSEVESLTLSAKYLAVMKNNTAVLTATVLPDTLSDISVSWSSSDESIATVDANGVVTGVSVGECMITAVSNQDPSVSADCIVEVITIDETLNGIIWDEEGEVWWSEFNINDPANYTRLTSEGAAAPIWSAAFDVNGTLYVQDYYNVLYSVDQSTFELTEIGSTDTF